MIGFSAPVGSPVASLHYACIVPCKTFDPYKFNTKPAVAAVLQSSPFCDGQSSLFCDGAAHVEDIKVCINGFFMFMLLLKGHCMFVMT